MGNNLKNNILGPCSGLGICFYDHEVSGKYRMNVNFEFYEATLWDNHSEHDLLRHHSKVNFRLFSANLLWSIINFNFCYQTSLMRYWWSNVEPLVGSNSILEHRRTKWTKNEFLIILLAKSNFEYTTLWSFRFGVPAQHLLKIRSKKWL